MKIAQRITTALVALLIGCGTLVGNPKTPGGDDSNTPPSKIVSLPTIDLTLPNSVTELGDESESDLGDGPSLNLRGRTGIASDATTLTSSDARYTLLHAWSYRLQAGIRQTNAVLQQLSNEEKVNRIGRHRGKGKDKNVDVNITELASGEDYDFSATICVASKPIIYLRWLEDGSRLSIIRDFMETFAKGKLKANFFTQVDISKDTDGAASTVYRSTGEYPIPKRARVDGPFLTEYIAVNRDASGDLSIKGVNDRHGEEKSSGFEGDEYLTGIIRSDGTGQFAGYRKSALVCKAGFDEADPALFTSVFSLQDPGFCLGRRIGDTDRIDKDRFLELLGELEDVGVASKDNLTEVSMPAEASCQ